MYITQREHVEIAAVLLYEYGWECEGVWLEWGRLNPSEPPTTERLKQIDQEDQEYAQLASKHKEIFMKRLVLAHEFVRGNRICIF